MVSEAPAARVIAGPGAIERPATDDREAAWLRDVYRPDEPNLTPRGVIAGILIGFTIATTVL